MITGSYVKKNRYKKRYINKLVTEFVTLFKVRNLLLLLNKHEFVTVVTLFFRVKGVKA